MLHSGDCRKLPKPKAAVACNRNITCGSAWAVGTWSQVTREDGGFRSEEIADVCDNCADLLSVFSVCV